MSVSWKSLAEGAVRLPLGRLMPKAAQRRLESCRGESSLESKALAVDRLASASISGMPPVFCGTGRSMDCARRLPAMNAAAKIDNVRFMMMFSVETKTCRPRRNCQSPGLLYHDSKAVEGHRTP